MKVKAAPGLRVPTEDNPRRYITDDQAVDVPRNGYYLRILAEHDLVEVADQASDATKKTKGSN